MARKKFRKSQQWANTDQVQVARECLRQIWQTYDLGGHSMGRSIESTLLETAMALIPSDGRFSKLADKSIKDFITLCGDMKHIVFREEDKCRNRQMRALDKRILQRTGQS